MYPPVNIQNPQMRQTRNRLLRFREQPIPLLGPTLLQDPNLEHGQVGRSTETVSAVDYRRDDDQKLPEQTAQNRPRREFPIRRQRTRRGQAVSTDDDPCSRLQDSGSRPPEPATAYSPDRSWKIQRKWYTSAARAGCSVQESCAMMLTRDASSGRI